MITIAGKKLDESSKSARVEGYFKSLEKLAKYVLSHLLAQMFCRCLFLDAGPFVCPTQAGALCVLKTLHVFQVGHHRAAHPLPHPRRDGLATHEVGAAPRDPEGAASFSMKV